MLAKTEEEGVIIPDDGFASVIRGQHDNRMRLHIEALGGSWPIERKSSPVRQMGPRLSRAPRKDELSLAEAERVLRIGATLAWVAEYDDGEWTGARTMTLLCRLWGLCNTSARHALGDAITDPSAAAEAWQVYLSRPDQRIVGVVYVAERRDDPSIIKVGFSTNVHRRMRELSSGQHATMRLLASYRATMLHEWAVHRSLPYSREMKSEWYRRKDIPLWLLPTEVERRAA
ncbi:GIY-YIG nuclease family protein [Ancylobacter sp.]|uniref:GIY-YIG nuclease family protein n=1 Tax=Ancylobacter sp. TaxID=1872567 RepID=UPI003BA9ACC7